ncbi:NfeD family protein [Mongoliibacter ruber]|uniref:NfeD-like partner-binding protein n=1 Tax=Mongoliibacter ruber TaxID=1750599 RepID=A0A2T0WMF0_9BACT|nr:NfeD family protein [Mongoliibacter ruber]PRY87883.1 NfeD-like partner-binding protein [Mongoliibacter ruber]
MTLFILTSLILVGVILLMTEIIFVPGTTLIGILGLLFSAAGVYYGFLSYGTETGWIVLAATLIINFGLLIYGFKSGVWTKFALKDAITSRSFDDRLIGLEKGQEGKAVSDIKPIGKAEFGDIIYEVKSDIGFIRVGSTVFITKLEDNKIIVKT